MDENAFDYNEYVTSKLCEWADPQTRLEKKRIQKQFVNQNCREWLKDLVSLDPVEIEMLAEDEGEAQQIKKDHAKYVRKAVFDEYTFKKKPVTKDMLEERQFRESGRKKTMELLEELKREQHEDCELDNTGYAGFLRRRDAGIGESGDGSSVKGKKWFTRPWLTKRGVSNESVCVTDDRNRHTLVQLQRLIRQALDENLKEKILETVRLLKAGILFDAIYVKAQEMVRTIVDNARRHVPESDHKWLEKLEEDSPETITDNMVDEIFEEAPLLYFQNKIKKYFIDALTIPITDNLICRGLLSKDPTLITTKFDRKEVFSMVKRELAQHHHVCTNFAVAEKIAKTIADEVVDVARFRMDVPGPDSEPSEPERNIKALYDQRLAAIKKNAEKQAKKNLEHLRDPENPRKDVFAIEPKVDKYGKSNCNCSKISGLGGKKHPFVFPEYKKKANYYFYNKFISDRNKNFKSATLYPKTRQNIKLVCDDHWKCIPVPLERELRDIPYRFSYAPQYVVKQIQRTKSIKKSDHPLIYRILTKMEKTKKVVDMDSILKKIDVEKRIMKSYNVGSLPSVSKEQSDLKVSSVVTISTKSEIISESRSTDTSKTKANKDVKEKDSHRSSKVTSRSHSARLSYSSATGDAHLQKALIPKTLSRVLKVVSRESQVPKAPDPPKYHEHILQGYKYDMVPITPCRFHSLKKIKAVLKRFETAGGPSALEYHFESRQPPVSVDELLPIPRLVDTYRQWRKDEEQDSSLWTRALNDSRLKRMAMFRKIHHKDPVFGFMSNWESPTYKCPV